MNSDSTLDAENTEENDGEEELTEKQREKLFKRCLNVAYYWLGRADQSTKTIEDKLRKKEIPDDIITQAIAYLHEEGYLDDASYAQKYASMRSNSDFRGKTAIRFELRRKGVDNDIIEEVVNEITTEDETEQARDLLSRKMKSIQGLDYHKQTARLVGLLARRGYSPGICYSLVKKMLAEEMLEEESVSDKDSENEDFLDSM